VWDASDLDDFKNKKVGQMIAGGAFGGAANTPAIMRAAGRGVGALMAYPAFEAIFHRFGLPGIGVALAALGGGAIHHYGLYHALSGPLHAAGQAGQAVGRAVSPAVAGGTAGKLTPPTLDFLYGQGYVPKGDYGFGATGNDQTP
jgi:hypothetical protein